MPTNRTNSQFAIQSMLASINTRAKITLGDLLQEYTSLAADYHKRNKEVPAEVFKEAASKVDDAMAELEAIKQSFLAEHS